MKRLTGIVLACLIGISLFMGTARASWAYAFVVYKGNSYVIEDTQVDPKLIGSKIGKVTSYTDREGTYSGNFSNQFPKGTEYYEILDVATTEAIAIKKSSQVFIKATYQSHYPGGGSVDDSVSDSDPGRSVTSFNQILWKDALPFLAGALFILFLIILYQIRKRRIRKGS
ncbi:hypothetical protein Back11_50670 [Paenibacillus baekrokdamisoli]|uniref:Uncharacterized protein n=1 Tax=Paenibacillus baekrokdamisoli TaxID=1712516 RepID=A0A3G9IZL5_9BACL|nr:hypothetical protein [Paenibacillus baekrokdamisoli]MBB3068896.1 hypothetical protein [Paenibacillus baekrokdamisoli]BBH23722.1 hypothetical protein Back11_50670 [Paenibacillus baekrokdamisoli]